MTSGSIQESSTGNEIDDRDLHALLLIRQFERLLLDLFAKGDIRGTTHTCIGQEIVSVAVLVLLRDHDFVFSNHRSHGHYLARYRDPTGLLSEVLGKSGSLCGGVGGSQHLYRSRSFISSGVQGSLIPVAAGLAFHRKYMGTDSVSVVFIGDGTWGQGVVYETLNIASLWQIPILFVVENNRIAQSTPIETAMAGSIGARVESFDVTYSYTDDKDLYLLRDKASDVLEFVRSKKRPAVLEVSTNRLGPHSKSDDTRTEAEMCKLFALDWEQRYERSNTAQYGRVFRAVQSELEAVLREVLSRADVSPMNEHSPVCD